MNPRCRRRLPGDLGRDHLDKQALIRTSGEVLEGQIMDQCGGAYEKRTWCNAWQRGLVPPGIPGNHPNRVKTTHPTG
jgi:hypothetical protein